MDAAATAAAVLAVSLAVVSFRSVPVLFHVVLSLSVVIMGDEGTNSE